MPKNCAFFDECQSTACVRIRHTGECLCRKHFVKNIERRAADAIERYHMLAPATTAETGEARPEHWIIGMSGGKDSQALAHVLLAIYGNANARVRFSGLYIDVGVTGNHYTDESREIVERTCARLGIPCVVVDVKQEYGVDMDDFHVLSQCKKGAKRAECSSCGILKRYLINREAARMGGDKVATGHHLTDESNMLLNNFFNVSVEQMARAQPWEKVAVAGAASADSVLLPRVKPFLEVTEEETTMYVRYAELEYVATQCPYATNATTSALKKHMIALEMDRPGTMLRMVRGYHESFLPVLRPANAAALQAAAAAKKEKQQQQKQQQQGQEGEEKGTEEAAEAPASGVKLNACTKCGCLTVVPVCAFCKIIEQANEYKQQHPELFDAASAKRHRCGICMPGGEQPKSVEDLVRPAAAAHSTVPAGAALEPVGTVTKRLRDGAAEEGADEGESAPAAKKH